ncbi:MAG: hypothetical protein H8F28_21070 [Fibrella sp.]|nr:hypothetical protein [Armatimonadota bacterium]
MATEKSLAIAKKRAERAAAGYCYTCGRLREAPARGGATRNQCARCAERARNQTKSRREAHVNAGLCGRCGKPSEQKKGGTGFETLCPACSKYDREWQQARTVARVAQKRCTRCGKPRGLRKQGGATTTRCTDCVAVQGALNRARRWNKVEADYWGPAPTGEPSFVGRAAKLLGPSKHITFGIDRPTMEAIWELKRRYREAHPGKTSKYHVSEIIREAVAKALKGDGPAMEAYQPFCQRGHRFTVQFPMAQYNAIVAVAKKRFDGSRAKVVRLAIRQAVIPPFVIATGPKRVIGGRPRTDWDDL